MEDFSNGAKFAGSESTLVKRVECAFSPIEVSERLKLKSKQTFWRRKEYASK
jgi:hypothetical protein